MDFWAKLNLLLNSQYHQPTPKQNDSSFGPAMYAIWDVAPYAFWVAVPKWGLYLNLVVPKPVHKGKIIKDDIEDINFMKYTAVE